jgi:hypothetical protein
MARTHKKVRYSPDRRDRGHTPASAAEGVEQALKVLEGRWKLVILFHLFDGKLVRFSQLERAIASISQKMLIQQLRQLERRRCSPDRPSPSAAQSRIRSDRLGRGALPGARRVAQVGCVARGLQGQALKPEVLVGLLWVKRVSGRYALISSAVRPISDRSPAARKSAGPCQKPTRAARQAACTDACQLIQSAHWLGRAARAGR